MKIVALHIYGYGQLADVVIENLSDFQVFYGENEAGKSTIMAFIHGILFGFPTKQQAELRYEPKHHSKYGGKIRIFHEEKGYAYVERVKGKAAGDVKVMMDNGTIGGEELLKELLENFDKSIYQSVFSFNLQGLQNIHQMKGEELGKFLFSAGTLGTERLVKAENILQKELESRFKPSGKKPVLNGKLQAVHEKSQELKKSAAKSNKYDDLIRKREDTIRKIEQITERLEDIQKRKEKLSEWNRIEAIVKEERQIKKGLSDLGELGDFPIRGIERLEKLTEFIQPCHAKLKSINGRIEQVKQELESIAPDESFLKTEPELVPLLDQVPIYDQLSLEKQQYEAKLSGYEEEITGIKEKLHLQLNDEDIFSINTNIYMKNQVEIVSQKTKKLAEIKDELDKQYQEEKNLLEEIEKEIGQNDKLCLSKQERFRLEQQAAFGSDKKRSEEEIKNIREKIEFCQSSLEKDKAANGRQRLPFLIMEFILAGLTIYGAMTKQWILLFIGLAGIGLLSYFIIQTSKQTKEKDMVQTLKILKQKEIELIEKLKSAKSVDLSTIEEQLQRDQEIQEQLKLLTFKLNQQQSQFDKVITKFEEWEYETAENQKKLSALSAELHIPKEMAAVFLLEAFQFIEQYKSIIRERHNLLNRLKEVNNRLEKIAAGIKTFSRQYIAENGTSLQQSAYLLR
ncbi:AAA family ATPase [Neobacillus mesonae]|uniref:AAA family ATPase n=1 Tax=Neobacillus mesonae TaxID=1193713 RepID=UPI00203A8D62|nr:AAA family ATPase [Neobacillus mesonae]MCM3567904.1 AAA family ATPase [Neobacillus mesonae]